MGGCSSKCCTVQPDSAVRATEITNCYLIICSGTKARAPSPGKQIPVPDHVQEIFRIGYGNSVVQSHDTTEIRRGCFVQLGRATEGVFEAKVKVKATHSVGIIKTPCGLTATGFRVGSKYILTAWHVVEAIVRTANEYPSVNRPTVSIFNALNNPTNVYIDFGYLIDGGPTDRSQRFYFNDCVQHNTDCDFAIIEVWHPCNRLPEPFVYFSDPRPDQLFHLIGHSGGERKHFAQVTGTIDMRGLDNQRGLVKVRQWSKNMVKDPETGAGIDGYVGADNSSRELFKCDFGKGASGSPGVVVLADGRAVVVTMLVHGYPDWLYDPGISGDVKSQCSRAYQLEQGTRMSAIYEHMNRSNHPAMVQMCDDIFSHFGQTSVQATS